MTEYEAPHYERPQRPVSLTTFALMCVVSLAVALVVGVVVIGGMYGFWLLWMAPRG